MRAQITSLCGTLRVKVIHHAPAMLKFVQRLNSDVLVAILKGFYGLTTHLLSMKQPPEQLTSGVQSALRRLHALSMIHHPLRLHHNRILSPPTSHRSHGLFLLARQCWHRHNCHREHEQCRITRKVAQRTLSLLLSTRTNIPRRSSEHSRPPRRL